MFVHDVSDLLSDHLRDLSNGGQQVLDEDEMSDLR